MKQFEVKLTNGDLIEGLSSADVVTLAKSGRLTRESMIRQEGQERWHRAGDVAQVAVHIHEQTAEVAKHNPSASSDPAVAPASKVEPLKQASPRSTITRARRWLVPSAVGAVAVIGLLVVSWLWYRGDGGVAEYERGVKLFWGREVEKNQVEAVRLFRSAASRGHARAHFNLGGCYARGDGVRRDMDEALKWYRRAGELGDTDLQQTIGLMFAVGNGVPQDSREGAKWLRLSAEGGDRMGQYFLGMAYYNGDGVQRDYVEAVKWFRKSAEQGVGRAEFSLGVCYAKGEGVPQSDEQAVLWWRKAADGGHPTAREFLQKMGLR